MNKWQKVAYQIAKDDNRNEVIKISKREIMNYVLESCKKKKWPFEKLIDYKNWNKMRHSKNAL